MILGKFNAQIEPVISLNIIGKNHQVKIEAIIDTGFSGNLTLPRDLINDLSLDWRSRGVSILGDGSESVFDLYFGVIEWDGQLKNIVIDCVNTAPLVGMRLLNGYELTMQVVPNGNVQLQRLLRGE